MAMQEYTNILEVDEQIDGDGSSQELARGSENGSHVMISSAIDQNGYSTRHRDSQE